MDIKERVEWIKSVLKEAHADGIVYGNSGGKDCSLVSILCKMACDNTVGIIMPCESSRNYGQDMSDAMAVSDKFGIKNIVIDVTKGKQAMCEVLNSELDKVSEERRKKALININPRLRMITLYAYAAANNMLVAGTGNRSEAAMGYFTKWGDGAYDFNPISDLTVTEVYEMLAELGCPEQIIKKAPSAGLYEGQTDEAEMGISYAAIDKYLLSKEGLKEDVDKIERAIAASAHKRRMPLTFKNSENNDKL